MRRFKPNFMFTPIFQIFNTLMISIPGVFLLWIITNPQEPLGALYVFPTYAIIGALLIAVGNLIHFITMIFTKPRVIIDGESIRYSGKRILARTVALCDIKTILFDQGSASRYSPTPCSLNLLDSLGDNIMAIDNPSFFMILHLRRKCPSASFRFNNYKWYVIFCIIFTVAAIVLGLVGGFA